PPDIYTLSLHDALPIYPLQVAAHAEAVDLPAGGKRADHHRNVVLAPLAVDDVGEQERLPVPLLDAAAKLPADQRVHFRVLVDRADRKSTRLNSSHLGIS